MHESEKQDLEFESKQVTVTMDLPTFTTTDIIHVPGVPFQPNPQQQDLLRWMRDLTGSLNLIARAGCGKSTALMLLVKFIVSIFHPRANYPRIFMGAFNKAIAEELAEKMGFIPGVEVATMHSLGMRLCKNILPGKIDLDSKKVQGLAKKLCPWDKKYVQVLVQVVGYAKQSGFGVKGCPELKDKAAWTQICDHHDVWDDVPSGISPERLFNDAYKLYNQSLTLCQTESRIDFDDMILVPLMFGGDYKPEMFDWVLIDEAQDQNQVRRMLGQLVLKTGGRMVAVGDPCQPTGTKVYVIKLKATSWETEYIKETPIEDVKKGDMVVSYTQSDRAFVKGRKVLGTSMRRYTGNMVEVTTKSGKHSRYTPNHHCLVNFAPLRGHYCVYLMRRDGKFRVGAAKLDYGASGCGPTARVRAEKADACWVLSVFETKKEAFIEENVIAANFGLPQLMFTTKNNSVYSQVDLDLAWSRIEPNRSKAQDCLWAYDRELDHPLISGALFKESLKRPIIARACNIMTGCLVLPYSPKSVHVKKTDWEPVTVKVSQYQGFVYSLSVEKEQLYCADGIITHNCQAIYGFAGASHDSMDQIRRDMHAKELPLSTTYRCPKSVVKTAQQWVPDIQAHESAPDGVCRTINHDEIWGQAFTSNDVILCRVTRPLIGLAQRLRTLGVPCVVEGNNGHAIVALATKWGEITVGEMRANLKEYMTEQRTKWTIKGRLDKVEGVEDRVKSVNDIADGMDDSTPVRKLVQRIESLFGQANDDRDVLRLCTIHRSKGREWDRVFWLGPNEYQPSKWAKKDWEWKQEENLMYVAVTRAKRELVTVEVPPYSGGDEDPEWWEVGYVETGSL